MQEAIVKLSSLGDIIHWVTLLPMFENRPRTWFVDENFSDILKYSPYITCLHPLPIKKLVQQKKYFKLYCMLKELRNLPAYHHVIDAQGLIKSAIVTHFLPSKQKIGFSYHSAKEGLAALFYNKYCIVDYKEHIFKRNAQLLCTAYNIPYSSQLLEEYLYNKTQHNIKVLDASTKAKKRIQQLLGINNDIRIVFVLEASKLNKVYPQEQFIALAKLLKNTTIYLLWHQAEHVAREIASQTGAICLPLLSLDEVKALLLSVNLVIGGDTGIVHLAYSLNVPSITLFGNTPIERFAMIDDTHKALRAHNSIDYNKNDYSIRTIAPQDIAILAEELICKTNS